jgi:predicted nucleic acid-binding protein
MTAPIVVDASVAGAWALPDEDDALATAALHRVASGGGVAPALFAAEIRNVLLMAERRKRTTPPATDAFLTDLSHLPIEIDAAGNPDLVLGLARHHRLSFYDALYLELARRRSLELATLDRALAAAAQAEGLTVLAG